MFHNPILVVVMIAVVLVVLLLFGAWLVFGHRGAPDAAESEPERAWAPDRLADRVDSLEARVQRLEFAERSARPRTGGYGFGDRDETPMELTQPAPVPRAAPPAHMASAPPQPWPQRRHDDAPAASDEDAIATLLADPAVLDLLDQFNQLAAAGDRPGLQAFGDRNGALVLAEGKQADELLEDPDGPFWWVEVDSERFGLLVPAPKIVQTWDKFYRSLSGAHAKAELGAAYDIQDGASLKIVNPAWARRAGPQAYRRVARGLMLGT